MPLAAYLPVIDNRRFDDLVAEARTRIPRYTPEWTDYNPGDAGFALVELFAWMTELLTYRLGQVPELNYLKFLELIGIELEPARPAQIVFLFPVQTGFTDSTVLVPTRTQVAAPPDAGAPIVFETQRPLTALKAVMDAVQVYDGFNFIDVSVDNTETGPGFQPFGPLANADAALLLGFSSDLPFPAGAELSLAIWPATDRGVPPPIPCGGGASAMFAPAQLVWEFWAGSEWRPLKLLFDDTLAFTRPGFVRLKLPGKGEIVTAKLGAITDKLRAWLRARLVASAYEAPPVLALVRANAVPAMAAQTVLDEVLGGSDGTPNQVCALSSIPVLDGTLQLQVDEGTGFVTWTEADDFAGAGPNDLVYLLDPTTGQIRFGDGVNHGHIPVANLSAPASSIVARSYQFGGGARTNIEAGTPLTLMTGIVGIDAGKIANPLAAYGGRDEETLAAAKQRAPQALKSHDRAVTAEDFELLAKEAGPIRRAVALPLVHPDFPGTEVPGVVTVIVVPDVASPTPMPSPGLLRAVCAYLDARRLITTELYVIAPTYVPVAITLDVLAQADADVSVVKQAVEDAITGFLDPRSGGSDGLGWPFGGTIYFVDILRAALVTDVIRVADLVITLNGTDAPNCTDVPIPTGALLSVQSVDANVTIDPAAIGNAA